MDTQSYLSFAENDYAFFKASIGSGMVYNALPALAQNACEKYLKDIIDRYFEPIDEKENFAKTNVLRTHSLTKLLRFVEENLELLIDERTKDVIEGADGYYFSTRYPGDNSIEVNERDIRKADAALEYTRNLHRELEQMLEKQELLINHDDDICL